MEPLDKKVDESWKEQIAREREVEQAKAAVEGEDTKKTQRTKEPPRQVNFTDFVQTLVFNALFCMGEIRDEENRIPQLDLPQAKYLIDLIGLLETKTKGNLTDEESQFITNALYDLRMRFVGKAK